MTPPAASAARRPVTGPVRPETRPRRRAARALDLSRKSGLVSRFWSRGPGFAALGMARTLRRLATRHGAWVFGVLIILHFVRNARRVSEGAVGIDLLFFVLGGLGLSAAIVFRLRQGTASLRADHTALGLEAELGPALLGVGVIWAVIGLSGGDASPARALLFVLVAIVLPWSSARASIVTVGAVLGTLLLAAGQSGALATEPSRVVLEGGFVVAFAILYDLSLSTLVRRARGAARAGLAHYLAELERRAREYRLIVSHDGPGDPEDGREKWLIASVAEVEAAVRGALQVAEAALSPHTAAVYLLSPDGERMRLRECLTRAEVIRSEPIAAGEGLPGVVHRRGAPLRIHGSFRGAVYDESKARPQAFLAVPLLARVPGREQPLPRGVLLVDRLEDQAFTEAEEHLLETLAREVLRAIEGERVLGSIRKEKDEKARFFRAIETLNLLSKPAEICEQVARLALELVSIDFVAVTLAQAEGDRAEHRVAFTLGPGADPLQGARFSDNAGLVSNVVRLGSPLPGRDYHLMTRTVVFDETLPLDGLSSLKVIPMTVGETVVGTLVCGAREAGVLGEEPVRMLGVLAMQAAGSIARGRLFERTEELATTDGLTGLTNHRRFQESLEGHVAASRRYGRSVSLVITDVDHFKGVNDTYGHPVGDEVLRGVAEILRAQARDTDICARYGGEEFAVVLPETDAEGAFVIAERIRAAIEARVFSTELGPLKITLSAGVATFPEHGEAKQAIIDRCDRALYAAKRGGRNRVVSADAVR